ncbi:hypothetical protein T484DRAFT_1838401, partial [Baffinella frigidus]
MPPAVVLLVLLVALIPSASSLAAPSPLPLNTNAGVAAMAGHRRTLVTFDIDGTIVRQAGPGANAMHTLAFAHAFKEVFGLDAGIDEVKHAGSTDQLILCKVLAHRGLSIKDEVAPKLPELRAAMLRYVEDNREGAADGLELLPGVKSLLEEQRRAKT